MLPVPGVRRADADGLLRSFARWFDAVTLDHFNPALYRPRGIRRP